MFFLKWLLVLVVLGCGAFFIANGLGVEISLVKYKGLEAHGVPVGAVLLVAGIALAAFWKISENRTYEETFSDGLATTKRKWTSRRRGFF